MLPHADDVARDLETALWTDRTCVRGPARSATLVAFAHGYATDARDYVGLVRVLANLPGKPDLRILHYGASRFRRGSPSKVSHELGAKLAVAARHYDEVLLCGHSMGGLFLREAYLDGLDKNSHWAHKVRLIVLLASTNRGFIPTRLFHRVLLFSVARAWWLALMALVAGLWLTGVFEIGRLGFVDLLLAMTVYLFAWTGKGGFLVEEVLRGADWIAALRLRWIDRFPGGGVAPDPPDCVHLRGEQDHLVEEDDHHELSRFAGTDEITLAGIGHRDFQLTPGRWFIFWENPRHRERLDQTDDTGASRRDRIVRMLRAVFTRVPEDARRDPANKSIAPPEEKLELSALDDRAARRVAMARVLESSRDRRAGARPEIVAAESRAIGKTAEGAIAHGPVSPAPGTVVFLIHGIRDYADWHRTLEHEIKQRVPLRPPVVHSVKYGYFSALQFLLPHERHRAARAFLDLYAQERAARPRDRFLVVAHSNGTFVLAKTLAVPRVRIDRIYLAGSVMGRRTLWPAGALVRNACAPADEPVGAICWVLSLLPRYGYGTTLPLGVGGVAGFAGDAVQNFGLRSGGHGAGLVAAEHPAIASFLLDDPPPPPPEARPKPSRLYLVSIRLLLIVILSLAVGAGWWSYSLAPAATLQSLAGALVALLVVRILIWF